jgi:hypothetical protein
VETLAKIYNECYATTCASTSEHQHPRQFLFRLRTISIRLPVPCFVLLFEYNASSFWTKDLKCLFVFRKNIPVSIETQNMDQKVSFDDTGTVVDPLSFEMLIEYLNPQNETYYFAFVTLSRQTTTCDLNLSAVNKTAAAFRPSRNAANQNDKRPVLNIVDFVFFN